MDEEIQFSVITNFIVKEKWVKTGKKERHMNRSTYVYGLQFLLLIFRVCKLIPHPSKRGTLIKALIKKISRSSSCRRKPGPSKVWCQVKWLHCFCPFEPLSWFSKKILSTSKYILASTCTVVSSSISYGKSDCFLDPVFLLTYQLLWCFYTISKLL